MVDGPNKPKLKREDWINLDAPDRIKAIGHRAYVGGHGPQIWYGIGKRQYHYLVSQGLRPDHKFLDIACGSLRLAQWLIPMLNTGNYFGLEAEPALVQAGLEQEMLYDIATFKQARFGYGYDFDFGFVPEFDMAIAQSLFTHLTPDDISLCLTNLAKVAGPESVLFFTYHEGEEMRPDGPSHANKTYRYPQSTIAEIAANSGWHCDFVGDWGHERGQLMVKARLTQ
ncbi:class I SAM-dependent methyltransferase [Shimia ponticola]|uniref:class I SAM-dependent methyltransferase n=1 Tax=Shimia ponticola TaxID=2582893 RepID=UPI0011BD812C|nr:class I SAM-dependent methyltransferase [Shimia ponticola]